MRRNGGRPASRCAVALLCVGLAGCSGSDPGAAAGSGVSDCANAVQYADVLYVEGGSSSRPVEPLGEAFLASCDDTGPDPRGADISDDPSGVTVGQFPGYDPGQVLGAQIRESTVVLFAEDVPEDVRREIARSGLVEAGTGPYTEDAFAG